MSQDNFSIGTDGYFQADGAKPGMDELFSFGWFAGLIAPPTAAKNRLFAMQNQPLIPKKKWRR